MFEIRVKVDFPAAHHLVGYNGDCARPHGHNWVLEVFVKAKHLDSVGIAIDFRDLKRAVKEMVERWDHQNLNELSDFKSHNPTAENIAKLAYEKLAVWIRSRAAIAQGHVNSVWVDRVTVWENERCWASYFEGGQAIPASQKIDDNR